MGTRRSVVALWIALLFAGAILAFMTRGAGPLPGDLALTMWLREWLPPDGLIESSLAYVGRLVWLLPIGFLAFALLFFAFGVEAGACVTTSSSSPGRTIVAVATPTPSTTAVPAIPSSRRTHLARGERG